MIKRVAVEEVEANFFIPMVDLMVSAVFIFIIIVMVLMLLIQIPTESENPTENEQTSSSATGVPVKPAIFENTIANQTAEEIVVKDVIRNLLKLEGIDGVFDADKSDLMIRLTKPKKNNIQQNELKK